MGEDLLFTTRSYARLGNDVAAQGAFETGQSSLQIFPDGELYQRVVTPVHGRDVALIAGTGTDADTLEAFDLAFALIEQGARSLTLAIPFFGYATMERAWRNGDAVKAVSRARLWSSLPVAPMGNRILILEPHTPGLPFYFGRNAVVSAISGIPLMLKMLERFPKEESVLCSPDVGRIKWVDELALLLGWPSAFVVKRRNEEGAVEAMGLIGSVRGKRVVLCDDMIRTGKTLLRAAEACLQAGAASLAAIAIHGAFTKEAISELDASGLFATIGCTDSHPNSFRMETDRLHVESSAELLAEALGHSLEPMLRPGPA